MAELRYAGEYIVDVCELYSTSGAKVDLSEQYATVSIFEDIFSNFITGTISFVDTNNLITNLPIVGQEKLLLKLTTPNGDDVSNRLSSIDFTDNPLYVYKVSNKVQVNDNTVAYTLSFTTGEAIRANRIRLAQSFEGEPAVDIVQKILRDSELLSSTKEYYYELTSNNFKFVAPNIRPMLFVNGLARRSLSKEYNNAPTFLFYETIKGFYFRTIDSMMDRKNPRFIYRELTPNTIPEGESRPNAAINLTNIMNYSVLPSTDVMMNMRNGMYGSHLTQIDLLNKTVEKYTYNYFDSFAEDVHADEYNAYGSQKAPLASEARDDFNNRLSDYDNAATYMQIVDRDSPNGLLAGRYDSQYDYMGTDIWLQRRRGRFSALDSAITLRVEVPGNTTLQVGDLVGIEMRNQGILAEDKRDPYFSGRYLVRKLRHEFTKAEGMPKHTVIMEVVRDTISQPYPSNGTGLLDSGENTDTLIPLGSESPNDVTF